VGGGYEELHELQALPNVKVIKSRRMRWANHVAHIGDMRIDTKFWLEDMNGRDLSEYVGADGRIILERILGK
jgi:hypothetical protein